MPAGRSPMQNAAEQRLENSGKKATKRSVSETKKKFVASRQNWKCGDCQTQLNAWFEVDHIKRLEYGGSNHIDNLVALCRARKKAVLVKFGSISIESRSLFIRIVWVLVFAILVISVGISFKSQSGFT